MSLRVSNLRLAIDQSEQELIDQAIRALRVKPSDVKNWRILRKSLDARRTDDLHFVCSAEIELGEEEARILKVGKLRNVSQYSETSFVMPSPGQMETVHRPIVVGSGPGGLAAAYFLAQAGFQPLVIERGPAVRDRIRDVRAFEEGGTFNPESNYLFGEGGAGTFSDGKLTCRGSGPEVHRILQWFAEHKGKPSLLYDHRPHLGSNRLPAVVKSIRRGIQSLGGEFLFSCRMEDIDFQEGSLRALTTSSGTMPTTIAVLAIGHSARDTYEMLARRHVPMEQKPFQMGVRVEHPQELVNRVQYGETRAEQHIGSADYSLVARGRHDVFTFCMCAGGHVIPSVSEPGYFCTNGMSLSDRDSPFANSGLVVTVPTSSFANSDVLAGVRLQQRYEKSAYEMSNDEYRCPVQSASDFLSDRCSSRRLCSSYPRGTRSAELGRVLPVIVHDALKKGLPIMDRRWRGRFLPEAVLVGPESRGSAPVRIVRDPSTRSSPGIDGLYPVGEGAGYAGGIVSAAVDGLRTAMAIIARYAPLSRRG